MATISPNDHAPDEKAKYILPTATFDLAPGDTYETDDRQVLVDAEANPWLKVEYPEFDETSIARQNRSVPAAEDRLSASYEGKDRANPFDPDQVRAAEEAKVAGAQSHVAIEAGLDQGKVVEVGNVDVTLAAANDDNEPAKKGSRKED